MASTKRGNILEYIRALIQALPSVKLAEEDSTRALHSVDPDKMPFVNITSFGKYNPQDSGIGSVESWDLNATINIITKSNNAEDIRGDIKEAMALDETQGGHAVNTVYEGDLGIIDLAIPSGAQGKYMEFMITYITEGGKKI